MESVSENLGSVASAALVTSALAYCGRVDLAVIFALCVTVGLVRTPARHRNGN